MKETYIIRGVTYKIKNVVGTLVSGLYLILWVFLLLSDNTNGEKNW